MHDSGGPRIRPDELLAYLNSLHNKPTKQSSEKGGGNTTVSTSKSAASHAYDNYRERWDKFDVDAALRSVGGDDQPDKAAPKSQADVWRERGNDMFKAGDYTGAVACYTTSIESYPTCVGFANRAMAKLKLKDYTSAQQDCSSALELDSSYVKAWLRRASAQRELGQIEAAIADFEAALRLEPGNKAAAEDRRACVKQWAEKEGRVPPKPTILPVKLAARVFSGGGVRSSSVLDINASKSGGDFDLLKQVTTTRTVGGADERKPSRIAHAIVQEVSTSMDREDHGQEALPPLPHQAGPKAPLFSEKTTEEESIARKTHEAAAIPIAETSYSAPTAALALGAPTTPPPRSAASLDLKAPRTGIEFERAWRGFKSDMARQAAYLGLLDAHQLPALLKQALTPGLLVALEGTLLGPVLAEDPAHAHDLLQSLPQVPRFGMNVLSVSAAQKKQLTAAWDAACTAHPNLAALRPPYSV